MTKISAINHTTNYIQSIHSCECSLSSIAAKVTILAFPVIIGIALFLDLLSRCKPHREINLLENQINKNPNRLSNKINILNALNELYKTEYTVAEKHEIRRLIAELKNVLDRPGSQEQVVAIWEKIKQLHQFLQMKEDKKDTLRFVIEIAMLDKIFSPSLFPKQQMKVLDALSAKYADEYVPSGKPSILSLIKNLKETLVGKKGQKSTSELWKEIALLHEKNQEGVIDHKADRAHEKGGWWDGKRVAAEGILRLAVESALLAELFSPSQLPKCQIKVLDALHGMPTNVDDGDYNYLHTYTHPAEIRNLITELKKNLGGRGNEKTITALWKKISEMHHSSFTGQSPLWRATYRAVLDEIFYPSC